jgi:hypothetical protein
MARWRRSGVWTRLLGSTRRTATGARDLIVTLIYGWRSMRLAPRWLRRCPRPPGSLLLWRRNPRPGLGICVDLCPRCSRSVLSRLGLEIRQCRSSSYSRGRKACLNTAPRRWNNRRLWRRGRAPLSSCGRGGSSRAEPIHAWFGDVQAGRLRVDWGARLRRRPVLLVIFWEGVRPRRLVGILALGRALRRTLEQTLLIWRLWSRGIGEGLRRSATALGQPRGLDAPICCSSRPVSIA